MKVGYLGPKGTFSSEACNNYCKNNEEKIEYKTIVDTILALEDDKIDVAIVPIENSLQGCVTDAIDTLIKFDNIKVIGEILLDIKQNLMTNKKCKLDEIKEIYSHPQAIAQCRNYLEKNFKHAKVIPVESTSYAAKKVSEKEEICACIGNLECAKVYNVNLIEKNIQDNEFNQTKFWILSKKENENISKNKMCMIFSVKDKPGALYNVLRIFNEYNLNLTKIESRPAKTVFGEYYFWIDVSINKNSDEDKAIEEIKKSGIYVRIFGKY